MDAAVVKRNDVLRGNKAVAYIATSELLDIEKLKKNVFHQFHRLMALFKSLNLVLKSFHSCRRENPIFTSYNGGADKKMQSAYIVGAKRSIVSPINGPLLHCKYMN